MAAAYRAVGTVAGGAEATKLEAKTNSATVVGDYLVFPVLLGNASKTATTPTGWEKLGEKEVTTGEINHAYWYGRYAAEAGEKTHTVNLSGTSYVAGQIITIKEPHATEAVLAKEFAGQTSSTEHKAPALNPGKTGTMSIVCGTINQTGTGTPPTNWTERQDNTIGIYVATRDTLPNESTGEPKVTLSVARVMCIGQIIIQGVAEGKTVEAAAALTGTGALSAVGLRTTFVKPELTGTGALSAKAISTRLAKAQLSGTGSLSAVGLRTAFAKSSLSGLGSLSAKALQTLMGRASLTGAGSLSAKATATRLAKAELTGTGSLTANAEAEHKAGSGQPRRPFGRRYRLHNPPQD